MSEQHNCVPPGWKLVPINLTPQQLTAISRAYWDGGNPEDRVLDARVMYGAALAAAPVATQAAGDAAQAELVTRLRRALYQIAHWPDDGTPCSQEKIKHFAIGVLDGDPVEPLAAVGVLHPHDALRYMACRESAIERGLFATPEEYDAMVDDSLRKKGKEALTGRGNNYGKKVAKDGSLYRPTAHPATE